MQPSKMLLGIVHIYYAFFNNEEKYETLFWGASCAMLDVSNGQIRGSRKQLLVYGTTYN